MTTKITWENGKLPIKKYWDGIFSHADFSLELSMCKDLRWFSKRVQHIEYNFNIKMSFYQYMGSHYKDKTVS